MSEYFEIFEGGEARVIGGAWLPTTSTPEHLTTVFGDTPDTTLIPRDQWKPVTLKAFCPPPLDQDGVGACCSFDSVMNIMVNRAMVGLPHIELSPGDLYRVVSGGRDRGSLPEDNLRRLMEVGVLTTETCPPLEWRNNRGSDAERARFKILEAYWCPTFDHAASALQQGFTLNCNVWWYNNDPIDSDGWQRDAGSGGRGGHSICGIGLANRNGKWGIEELNSWGIRFGIKGYSVLPERRCVEGCQVFRWWATRGVVNEDSGFPAPREQGGK